MKKLYQFFLSTLLIIALSSTLLAQWVQTNGPYGGYVGCFTVSDTHLFAGTGVGVFLTTNNGSSWTEVNTGLTNTSVTSLAVSATNLFAGTWNGGVFLSTNNGTSWTEVNNGLTNTIVYSLAVGGTNLFAGTGGGGVFLSTNNGTSWAGVNAGLTDTVVFTLAVSTTNLFAGTYSGVFLSTDNGSNWTAVNTGLPVFPIINDLTVNDTYLFAGTSGYGVYLSTNNGSNWTAANTGLTTNTVYSFTVGGTYLFAGSPSGGVYLSTNNGTSWTTVNTGLPNTNVYALTVSGTYLFAGTNDGVWQRPLSEMITSVEEISSGLPIEFSLEQNYPNPFNPSTTFVFSLPERSLASLKVFDILGKEVALLISEELPAGTYTKWWDASGLPSGTYFYRLQTGSFSETKKLILLR